MPAIISNTTRVFNANQFLNAFQAKNYNAWATATSYNIGDIVYNSFYKYIAITAGTSGATPPTHTSGTASDGGVDWLFVESFIATNYFKNNVYIGIGKVDPWYDFTGVIAWADSTAYVVGNIVQSTVDSLYYICIVAHTGDGIGTNEPSVDTTNWTQITAETPIDPVDDYTSQYSNLSNLIAAKRLSASVVKYGVRRYNWTSGTIYSKFDPDVQDFNYATPNYVLTADNNIYKCIDNKGGIASTSMPTGRSVDLTTTADGYVWKYMATVAAGDAIQFLVAGYIPCDLKLYDDGTDQWLVQQNAKELSLSSIQVDSSSSDFTTASVSIGAPDLVGGIQATAVAIIEGGAVTAIQLTEIGSGYTAIPTVNITGDGTAATATAILAPKNGHGANLLTELDARYAIISARFEDTEAGYFPVTGENDFRQLMVVVDPRTHDDLDATAARYIGPSHDLYTGDGTSGLEELKTGSGEVIYIENIAPVIRATGQIEDIKIVLKF